MTLGSFFLLIVAVIDAYLVPLVFALAFLAFIWGLYRYFIAGSADEEKRKQGKQFALSGVIGFVIIFALWGIVNIVLNTFGFGNDQRPPLPIFDGSQIAPDIQTTGSGGKPLGVPCPSRLDSECSSGECDWNGNLDSAGQQIFVCVPQRSN